MKYFFTFALMFFIVQILVAQDLVTDRPDQTESPNTLPKSFFQLETGTLLEIENGNSNWVVNTNLFRYGICENFELRLVTELTRNKINSDDNISEVGINDLQLGIKFRFVNKEIEMAYLGHLIIPSGSKKFSSDTLGISNKICWGHAVTEQIEFGYNLGYDYFSNENHALTYSFAVGIGLTEKVGFYL